MTHSSLILSGAVEGYDAQLLANEATENGQVIHVARDDRRLEAMRSALAFFAPDLPVWVFPAWDCLPYDRVSPNAEVTAQRMATLASLALQPPRPLIVLTTINAATQCVPEPGLMAEASLVAEIGGRLDTEQLRRWLVRMGFVHTSTVTEPGEFAIRGGIIDVFPPGHSLPIRLDFFGDVLESARQFDVVSQRSEAKLSRLELAPASEVILDEDSIHRFRSGYRALFGAARQDDPLYEAVSEGRKHQGAEHWLPLFHDRLVSVFDYLPEASISLDDRFEAARESRHDMVLDHYAARQDAMNDRGSLNSVYKPIPPERLFLDEAALTATMAKHRVIRFVSLPQPTGPGVLDAGARIGRNFSPERNLESVNLFSALKQHVQAKLRTDTVVIASYSEGARDRLQGLLADEGLAGASLIRNAGDIKPNALNLAVWPLEHGFEAKGLTVISEQDVLGDRLIRTPKRKRRSENFITEAQSLSPGDLVVHVDHGIGRFHGLEVVTALGARHECLLLEYADDAKLYLPVENIELLSRYGHEEGLLDRLGGGAWQAKKAKLKERIREMAERLIRIAAERELRHAPIVEPPMGLWEAFAARFPYQETDDQLQAIDDVITDLSAGKPMDRLICGDVGFGKTEVALRAAFAAAMSGHQVAVIAPTTLLARQHAEGFRERFRGFPLEIRALSRFVQAKQAEKTRAGLADGTVDIVVGTHALLAKSIKFKRLGLLIVDEEQHFGVAHKERLKALKSDIHVLTLTATPIPRTLQLSLTGVRDLSIIATPPVDRLSIRTYVSEFDPVTIREALLRERYRGGQSFFVVPRVADLAEIEAFLAEQLPELRVITAHGQMAATTLDDRMNGFYDGKYDVLLATTIVESGLDIPSANTLVVWRADMFGLAQLYQIRGRVGRSKTRAYAYLTTKPRQKLTDAATKRLRVLGAIDTLGAGFTLASQDLDIRGAGNLVGEEQSGNMREVGFELYQAMLEDAISKIRAGDVAEPISLEDEWSPQINLGVSVLIPEDYIPDLDVRLGIYRRLANLSTKVEMEGLAAELIDRFGPLPREVNTLLVVTRVKVMCKRAGIARLDGGPKGGTVQFHNDKFANPAGLVAYIKDSNGLAKIKDNKLVVRRDWAKDADRIRGAFALARDLAAQAKSGG